MDTRKLKLRPNYSDATPEQLQRICNGVGPSWAPPPIRKLMTSLSGWFFNSASWQHHDFGYYIGCTEKERAEYDAKFFDAMRNDARQQPFLKMITALNLSLFFYISVRCFGWLSFYYGQHYQNLPVLL